MSRNVMPYPLKPRILRQPISWLLGKNDGDGEFWEALGVTDHETKRGLARVWLALRRIKGQRPEPIRSFREFYARGRRGYALSDTWSLDSYLCAWMPAAIADLREGSHGHPVGVCGHETWPEDCSECDGMAAWNDILIKIERGFVAAREILELDYFDSEAPREENRAREEALHAEFEAGMALFTKWFFGMWN